MNAAHAYHPGWDFDSSDQRLFDVLSLTQYPRKVRQSGVSVHRYDAPGQEVVAAVLTCRERLCLLRRSSQVGSDIGQWHCVTGFLPSHEEPLQQAIQEIFEETGISDEHLALQHAVVLELEGADGKRWRVHAFHFESLTDQIEINWENDLAQWVHHHQLDEVPTVTWLADVLSALHESILPTVTVR
ncbi:MAG: NUDIX domain-containing protein [Panacagrimonas sp.]